DVAQEEQSHIEATPRRGMLASSLASAIIIFMCLLPRSLYFERCHCGHGRRPRFPLHRALAPRPHGERLLVGGRLCGGVCCRDFWRSCQSNGRRHPRRLSTSLHRHGTSSGRRWSLCPVEWNDPLPVHRIAW
ncbi:unnamed protein product, partial [Heterosigma akashiwo]